MQACPRCGHAFPPGRLALCPVCLSAPDPELAFLEEANLEVLDELGRGGMGVVYRARDRGLGRDVAVKVLTESADPSLGARFAREARALARLSHPNIVTVHQVLSGPAGTAIVMELMASSLAQQPPRVASDALRIAQEVCIALAHAHARGVVHRDLKPANILFDGDGRAKVADFGIAYLLDPGDQAGALTGAQSLLGTPGYMAPETFRGAPAHPTQDVYALGVVLQEMLTAAGGDAPRAGGPGGALEHVVARSVAPDPAGRYASAAQMCGDLRAAAGRLGAGAVVPPDERLWLRAVALVHALATAVALWALMESVTPRVLAPGDVRPLVVLPVRTLPDGRVISLVRFETWPVLAALGAAALALAVHAALRRHWHMAGLLRSGPASPVRESRAVLWLGLAALALYAVRRGLEGRGLAGLAAAIPVLGGLLEFLVLFQAWSAALESIRTGAALRRDLALWTGLALALVPPILSLYTYLAAWRP